MTGENEFPRLVRLDSVGSAPRAISISADEAERAALARRFRLVAIDRLEAEAELRREGEMLFAQGQVRGEATQSCVATGDLLPTAVDAPFALRFAPAAEPEGDEVELSESDCDTIDYAGGAIDLGEAVAEEFALALDPFPRAPDADARLRAAGVVPEDEAGSLAGALKGLRDKLSGV